MANVFDYMDEASAALIIQLQIQDSQRLSETYERKGKGRDGEPSDLQLSFNLYREELERNAVILSDRKMARSVVRACQTDGEILTTSLSQEQTAASDRQMACRLGNVVDPNFVMPRTSTSEVDEESLAKLSTLYIQAPVNSESTITEADFEYEPESSSWAAMREREKALDRRCTACQELIRCSDIARVPCNHEYCRDCLQDLFRTSMVDDSLFPPRCCRQPITSETVRIFLTDKLILLYEQKKIEFDTPNRTYCSNPLCSVFIQPESIINEQATCLDCSTITCTLCKATAHRGDCPADTALQQLLHTANENGWQRCYFCHRLVELDIGCNHITCHCGAQFCYICAQLWKTCACAQWDEERLLSRANQVVARRPVGSNPSQVGAQVAAAAQNLRYRHNCVHTSWQYVQGEHRCEECYHTLPAFIFECRQCQIQVCKRCRMNRL
ncbi:putative ibr finger domain protein [Botrytis fragariae]|uniref:RBR-type E3 ubiquitin transferase n=1 Tax=Botrytis fragariae TaxID=1964551 RepID=A0A8H6EL55_9HELO|nr:putative ibr finger domain protein [Botrytis fragariae]KAF5876302.1 putative ibr finger domain protein [Botrytis fragariae]